MSGPSGTLGKASCSKGSSGDAPAEDTFWQARVVPEVKLLEDEQHQQPPAEAEVVPPQTTAVLPTSASCSGDRAPAVQYTVTPVINGVAQSEIYTSPLLSASKNGVNSDAKLGSASIHASWNTESSGKSELTVTISEAGK